MRRLITVSNTISGENQQKRFPRLKNSKKTHETFCSPIASFLEMEYNETNFTILKPNITSGAICSKSLIKLMTYAPEPVSRLCGIGSRGCWGNPAVFIFEKGENVTILLCGNYGGLPSQLEARRFKYITKMMLPQFFKRKEMIE